MGGTIRVLFATGEPAAGDALEREDDQFDVATVTDGAVARDRLAAAPVDCVISRHALPEMTGIDLLEVVREEHPEVPFILVTERTDADIAGEAINAGVTDYLQWPPEADPYPLLAKKVRMAVDQHHSGRAVKTATPDCDQFEFALKTTNTYIFDWNPNTGTIERYPTLEDLFGTAWEVSKPMFNAFFDFVKSGHRDRVKREIRAAIDEETGYDIVYPIETQEDRQRWIHERADVRETERSSLRVVGTVTDVTDLQEYEQQLVQQDQPQ